MRVLCSAWWLVAMGLIFATVPWAEAKSSSQTVGIQIIMPPRPTPAAQTDHAAPPADAVAEAAQVEPDSPLQRTTTLIHDGNTATLLVTDVQSL